jgi:hypothetical protein
LGCRGTKIETDTCGRCRGRRQVTENIPVVEWSDLPGAPITRTVPCPGCHGRGFTERVCRRCEKA